MKRKNTVPFVLLVSVLIGIGVALFLLMKPEDSSPEQTTNTTIMPDTRSTHESSGQATDTKGQLSDPEDKDMSRPSNDTELDNNCGNDPVTVLADAQRIGFFIGSETEMDPEIAEAFRKEGSTVLRDIEIPQTPDAVPVFTAVNREIDAVQLMKVIFGETVEYETQTLADNQGTLYKTTWHGAQYQIIDNGKFRDSFRRFAVRRLSLPSAQTTADPEAEARRFAEELLASPFLQGFQVKPGSYYSSLYQTSLVACEQIVDEYPISGSTYYVESDGTIIDAGELLNILGTKLTVEFDAYGLNGVELTRPLSITATGEMQPIRITAEAALENAISQANKRYNGHNVIAIRGISLQYLTPAHDGDPLIPVWVIPYDYYQNSLRPGSVEFDVGELAFIVDAQTGYVYPILM